MAIITGGRIIEGTIGPFVSAGAPTDGASGTEAGVAAVGALLIDATNANLYINAGTQASPAWKLVTRAA